MAAGLRRFVYRHTRGRESDRCLRQLRRAAAHPGPIVDRTVAEQLRALVEHARRSVPYYRAMTALDRVVANGGIDWAAWSDVPMLTRDLLRSHQASLAAEVLRGRTAYANSTGGTTGEPTPFLQDTTYFARAQAASTLFDLWSGRQLGDRQIVLWGSQRDLFLGADSSWTRAGRWLRGERWLNAFSLTDERLPRYVEVFNRYRPRHVLAYAHAVHEFARFVEDRGLSIHRPVSIMTSAGTLTPSMRATIERVFRAPVFNRYGARETGAIACECRLRNGLHVVSPNVLVEVVRPDGRPVASGNVGDVLVTTLTNEAMPLIRYRIGDLASWHDGPCACGCAWPRLRAVEGRAADVLRGADGRVVLPQYVAHLFGVVLDGSWIHRFQVVQEHPHAVRVRLMPRAPSDTFEAHERELQEIRHGLQRVLGHTCQVQFEHARDILPEPSGKLRFVVSRLPEQTPTRSVPA